MPLIVVASYYGRTVDDVMMRVADIQLALGRLRDAHEAFERALAMLHSFFFPETVKAFTAIPATDPSCAIAYWGIAYAAGPNYNLPWHLYDPAGKAAALAAAYDAMQGALARADGGQELFLQLPPEVLISEMRGHQKYFAVRDPATGADTGGRVRGPGGPSRPSLGRPRSCARG